MNAKTKRSLARFFLWLFSGLILLALAGAAMAQTGNGSYEIQGRKMEGFKGTIPQSVVEADRQRRLSSARPIDQSWQTRAAIEQRNEWVIDQRRLNGYVEPIPRACRPNVQRLNRKPVGATAESSQSVCIWMFKDKTEVTFDIPEELRNDGLIEGNIVVQFHNANGLALYKSYPMIKKSETYGTHTITRIIVAGKYAAQDLARTMVGSVAMTYFFEAKGGDKKAIDVLLPVDSAAIISADRSR